MAKKKIPTNYSSPNYSLDWIDSMYADNPVERQRLHSILDKQPYRYRWENPEELSKAASGQGDFDIPQLPDFGESRYDDLLASKEQRLDYQNIRGIEQSGLDQIKNGILKGAITTGTTYIDLLVGIPVGIFTAAAEGRLSGLWDNVITNAMQSVTDWSEEALPNYYTQKQQKAAWYNPVNLFSANFLGDKLIKNFGFSAGAALGMKTISKIPKLLPKLAKNQNIARAINSAETSFAGAVGEGSTEALNNTRDWANEQRTIIEQQKLQELSNLEVYYNELAKSVINEYGKEPEIANSILRGLSEDYQKAVQQAQQKADFNVAKLQDQIDTQGNLILAGNIPILLGSNLLTLGKMIGRGYKATQSAIDKYVIKEGNKYISNLTATRQALRVAKTPVLEGFEEMNQAVISTAAGNRATDYYEMSIDPNATETTKSYMGYLWDAFKQTYGDIDRYEEFVIGMLSSGISDIVLGQGKALKEEKQNVNDAVARANAAMNTFNTQSLLHYLNRQQVLEDQKTTAAIMNDKKAFKDAELAQVASAVTAFSEIGKIEDLKALIDTNLDNLTDAELDALADELQPQGVEEANFFKVMSYDQRRDYLKKQKDTYHKMIDMYSDARDKIANIAGTVFTPEEVSELTYYRVRADLAADRRKELIDTIEKKVTDTLRDKTDEEIGEIATHIKKSMNLSDDDVIDTIPQGIAKILRQYTDTDNEKNKDWFEKYFPQQDLFTDLKDVKSLEDDVYQYNKTLTDYIKNPSKLKNKRQKSRDKIINQKEEEKAQREKKERKEKVRKAKDKKFDESTLAEFDDDDLDFDTQRKLKDAYQRKRDEGKDGKKALQEIKEEVEDIITPIKDDGTEYTQEERERIAQQVDKAIAKVDRAEKRVSEVPSDDEDVYEEPNLGEPEPEKQDEPEELSDTGSEEPTEPTTQEDVIKSNAQSALHQESTSGELFRPQLSEYYLHGINEESYLDYIEEHPEAIPEGIDAEEYKQYIREVHAYLKDKGAFTYVKQHLKVGDNIIFYVDNRKDKNGKTLNEKSGQTVILIGIKSGNDIQCIGSLPTEIDFKSKSKSPIYNEDKTAVEKWKVKDKTLAENQPNRYKQYQELIEEIKSVEEEDGIKILGKSKVNKLYGGNLSRTDTNHPVSDTFGDTVPLIGVIKQSKLEGIGKVKVKSVLTSADGQVYVLIPQNNGVYLPALVYSRKLKEESNDSAYIEYLKNEFQKLISVSTDELASQEKSLGKSLRTPKGFKIQFVINNKSTEHRELATHLRVSINGTDIVRNIPIKDKQLDNKTLGYLISEIARTTNSTTGVDLNKLSDEKYRAFISNYLYFNILEPHSINDFFTYEAPTSKKKDLDKEEIKEKIDKQTPNTKNETFITKNNEVFIKDGTTGVWTYQETGELVPDEVLVSNGLKAIPINLNSQVTSAQVSSEKNDILAAINPNGNRPGYTLKRRPRNFTSGTTEPVESEKVLYQDIDKLAKILPSFNVNERIQVVQGLIDSVDKNGNPIQVYSNYVDGIIYISSETPKGVLYHEMFHYVSDMLLTDNEKKVLFEEAVKRYGNLDEFDLEEKLAEDFRKFMNNETDSSLKGILRRLFAKLKSLINKTYRDKDGIDILFWNIYKNKFNVNSNNVNNNFKQVLNTQQDIRLSYNNLDDETKQYLGQRKISPEAYEKLSGTFKQYLLKCM